MKKSNFRRGYTLLECLIALFLSTMVLSLASSVYLLGYRFFNMAVNQVEMEQSLRMAIERISKNVRMLNDPLNNVYISGDYLHIGNFVYYLNGNVLLERIDGGTNQLALNITDFQPSIDGEYLIVRIAGRSSGISRDMELTMKLFLGVVYE